jgi:hypothetical protein
MNWQVTKCDISARQPVADSQGQNENINKTYTWLSLDLGIYSAGNYLNCHLPRKGLVDFTSSQISPITL